MADHQGSGIRGYVISHPSLSQSFCPSFTAPAGQASTHFSTCNAVLFLNFCDVCRTRHIWCIKELWCTKCISDIYIAVTDSKILFFPSMFGSDVQNHFLLPVWKYPVPLLWNITSVFSVFHNIIRHITNCNAPSFLDHRRSLRHVSVGGTTAGTRALSWYFPLIFTTKPVGNMFQINRFIFHLDCFFNGMTCMPIPAPPSGTNG